MIKLFADGADMAGIIDASKNPKVVGFTTNPTLMRQAGVTDYTSFAKNTIEYLGRTRPDTCLSLEVFADDLPTMVKQARVISDWAGDHYKVYIKIPAVNSRGISTVGIVETLAKEEIRVNVTAVFTPGQIQQFVVAANPGTDMIVSIFAGRIADAGWDPEEIVVNAVNYRDSNGYNSEEFLWASPREVFNYVQAERLGCDIITMTPALIKKLDSFGRDLLEFSRETSAMFYEDAVKSGFYI